MVLETRLSYLYLIIIYLLSTGCHATSEKITDNTEILNYKLELSNDENKCQLKSNYKKTIKTYELKIKPPCYFLRKNSGSVQAFEYKDVGIKATILVIGNPISIEKRKKWNLDEKTICGESRNAILIKRSGLMISDKILEGGLACKDLGADEKDFWYFAH